jgi:hypothetical protein
MGEELIWNVVRTRTGAEDRVLIGIEKAGMAAYLPVEMIRVSHRGNHRQDRAMTWRPIFQGHLFVRFFPSRDLPRLREIHGVDDVVRRDGRLAPVSDDVVRAIRRAERDGLFDLAAGCRQPDDDAQPPDVRFAGLMTKIKRARWSKERTKLLVSLMVSR